MSNKRKFLSGNVTTSAKKFRTASFDDDGSDATVDDESFINDNKENVATQQSLNAALQNYCVSPTTTSTTILMTPPDDSIGQTDRTPSLSFDLKSGLSKVRIDVSINGQKLVVPTNLDDQVRSFGPMGPSDKI